jgi:hypothetical protein
VGGFIRIREMLMASTEEVLTCRDRWLEALSSGGSPANLMRTTLEGCRAAVTQLGEQLVDLGYPVQTFVCPAPRDLSERIARVESRTGVHLPKAVQEFWRVVGGISLVDLQGYRHVAFWDDRGITGPHGFSDGVHVDLCDDDWLAYTIETFESYAEDGDEEAFRFDLSPDGYHKDDISGGPPYAVGRDSDWAPAWENFRWSGYRRPETAVPDPTDFVSYLRTAILECGGFPGFLGHPGFETIRQKIVRKLPVF